MKVSIQWREPVRALRKMLAFALAICTIFAAGCAKDEKKDGAPKRAAAPVKVVKVERRDVPFEIRAVGNAEAFSMVAIKSRVAGQITHVRVRDGEEVKAGAVLFELDPKPFQERLRGAEATLARDQAAEKQSQAEIQRAAAQAAQARVQWERYQKLLKEGITAAQQAEEIRSASLAAAAQLNVTKAGLESVRAAIRADEAQVAEAKLDLSYTKIEAPVSGTAGFLQTKAGNLVKENDTTALITIAQHSPMYVSFAVPEQYLNEIRKYSAGGRKPTVEVVEDSGTTTAKGVLDVMDNAVDATTGTIKLKALFPNQDRRLWPGQFVTVQLKLRVDAAALSVPNNAVQTGPDGRYLWVVRGDHTAELRPVTTLRTQGEVTVLGEGVKEGETVIVSGQLRVAPNAPVKVTP
ncbi:MAG: efflux RND transporter periplasmic adaptor subunit [Acidobacteriota bacterium]